MTNKIGAYTESGPAPGFINITTIGDNAIIMVRERGENNHQGRVVCFEILISDLKALLKGMDL